MADVKIKVPKRNKPPRGACRRGRGKFKKAIKGVAAGLLAAGTAIALAKGKGSKKPNMMGDMIGNAPMTMCPGDKPMMLKKKKRDNYGG